MWSRRQFLTALSTSSAGVALGGWTSACQVSNRQHRPQSGIAFAGQDYRLAYETIASALEGAFVWSKSESIRTRSIDPDEKRSDFSEGLIIALGGRLGDTTHEVLLTNPTPEELVDSSRRMASISGGRRQESASLQTQKPTIGETIPDGVANFESLAELYQRSEAVSDSRIIFRSAYSRLSRVRTLFLANGLQRESSQSRALTGILYATWTGKDIATSTAESMTRGSTMQPVSDPQLRAAAQQALAPLHARPATLQGTHSLILSPAASACLLQRIFTAPHSRTNLKSYTATDKLTIEDRPSLGYTNFFYDDLGMPASDKFLVGEKSSSLGQGNWHRDLHGRLRCVPSNLQLKGSETTTRESLAKVLSGVEMGVIVDGPLHATLDSAGKRFVLSTNIAYELRAGSTTGRVFGPMSITADIDQFIAETQAIGGAPETYLSDHRGIAITLQSPYWRSRAHVESA